MAIVCRSDKISQFDQINKKSKYSGFDQNISGDIFGNSQKGKRIHASQKLQSELINRKILEPQSQQRTCASIPKQKVIFYYYDQKSEYKRYIQRKKMQAFRQLVNHRKKKYIKTNCEPHHKFYDLPSLFSPNKKPKSLVSYSLNKQNIHHIKSTPGPGAYQLKHSSTRSSPKFIEQVTHSIKKVHQSQDSSNNTQTINTFHIKYEYMNSPFYKSSLNNTKQSNKILLKKLLRKNEDRETADSNQSEELYESVFNYSPGPTAYDIKAKQNLSPKTNNKNFISGQERFKTKLQNQIGPTSYYEKEDGKYQVMKKFPPPFLSGSLRFNEDEIDNRNIQNAVNSFNESRRCHSNKKHGFDSVVQRKNSEFCKQAAQYQQLIYNQDNVWCKDSLAAKFGYYEEQRKLFNMNDDYPGPGSYQLVKKSQKQNNSNKNRKTMKKVQKIKQLDQKQNYGLNLQSHSQKQGGIKNKGKIINCSSPPQFKHKERVNQLQPVFNQIKYQQYKNQWLKKSYNKLFCANYQPLKANNPTQSKQI